VRVIGKPDVTVSEPIEEMAEPAVASFDIFYEQSFHSILKTATALTRDIGIAEDLTQDAFLEARRNWARISRYDRPDLWVRRVVVNRSSSWFRRLSREAKALARLHDSIEHSTELTESDPEVWEAIATLPLRQRQTVILVMVQDLTVTDAAEVLGCGIETVRTHLRRSRARLTELLGEQQ
jgi:RNA polymerase sigma factor (sigma-70 family)